MTCKNRGPAHITCKINVTQRQSNFKPLVFHNFSSYDCHLFFKSLVDKKKNKVEFRNFPETNEESNSIEYGCIKFIDSYKFLSSNLDNLVKNLNKDDFNVLQKESLDNW